LQARDHHARAAATRVLGYWHDRAPNALHLLTDAVADQHPQVRLEAVRALGQIPQPRAVELAMKALDRPVDRTFDYALWLTARGLEPVCLPAVQQAQLDFDGNVRHLLFALQAAGSKDVVKPLLDLLRQGKIPPERKEEVLTLIAAVGGPPELDLIVDQ